MPLRATLDSPLEHVSTLKSSQVQCFLGFFFRFLRTARQVSVTQQLRAPIHKRTRSLARSHRGYSERARTRTRAGTGCPSSLREGGHPLLSLPSPCLRQRVAMETGLDWKQQERKKERNPVLCPPLRHSSFVSLPLRNTPFQTRDAFPN